jgi:hypothetical protein
MPVTGNTYIDSFGTPSQKPGLSSIERWQMVASTTLDPGSSPKKFIAVALVSASKKLAAYNDGNSDGTQVCKGLLPCKAVSDSVGKISVNGGSMQGYVQDTVAAYTGGYFFTAEITGLDANGLADLGGHLVWGDFTTGEIVIPV